ncbi:hypothetical protein PCANC_16043 [Puccinia coronata f. sp. avenae]|uniref:Uncharacterized protein n=1 Tax=Puccinia coronata f. sp. avenae TaxID=200324 RepID=A0A2N5ULR2_9BASI|nr:hypothetical protein PCANC_16043 [Puccinia coronata f. sp. avenae]
MWGLPNDTSKALRDKMMWKTPKIVTVGSCCGRAWNILPRTIWFWTWVVNSPSLIEGCGVASCLVTWNCCRSTGAGTGVDPIDAKAIAAAREGGKLFPSYTKALKRGRAK